MMAVKSYTIRKKTTHCGRLHMLPYVLRISIMGGVCYVPLYTMRLRSQNFRLQAV